MDIITEEKNIMNKNIEIKGTIQLDMNDDCILITRNSKDHKQEVIEFLENTYQLNTRRYKIQKGYLKKAQVAGFKCKILGWSCVRKATKKDIAFFTIIEDLKGG
ncbi:MAG: hypothetical protein M0R03_16980 [Novosphingobium sp.]|nr:hypothetical protein [Novosphingobium sp.]